ncbi:SIMPL domain-containing protein [Flavobacterium sp.]|uniref:SIMPL domain-containing protein n=1 Tax=Flavobacterium sp. TaxID=239 RepID=UPI002618CE12|nr:SIMPL domain-containing protein [Flavobacterium sp.]
MKKAVLILFTLFVTMTQAQEQKQIPQVSVSGEGKIKVKPDQVEINFGVENLGKDAKEVKKLNDENVDKVVKFIKKFGIASTDFQTTNVSLNRNYDYDKKKYNYQASQSICILLKDITKYDELMMGLVDNGINNISHVEFKSSKIEEHKAEARKAAMRDAKKKAEDYVSVLGQKVGKALLITDNQVNYFPPQPMYKAAMAEMADAGASQETLAVGEIEVNANVSVSFILE